MKRLAWVWLLALAPLAKAQDELGLGKMWTFERPPLAYLKKEYGFEPDEAWWTRMRLASLRFGTGCSASFVSAQGLILTNHHCVREKIAEVQGAQDWVRDGFVANEQVDEVRLPKLTVQQLVAMQLRQDAPVNSPCEPKTGMLPHCVTGGVVMSGGVAMSTLRLASGMLESGILTARSSTGSCEPSVVQAQPLAMVC